jgi:hypothetical protein
MLLIYLLKALLINQKRQIAQHINVNYLLLIVQPVLLFMSNYSCLLVLLQLLLFMNQTKAYDETDINQRFTNFSHVISKDFVNSPDHRMANVYIIPKPSSIYNYGNWFSYLNKGSKLVTTYRSLQSKYIE